MLVYGGAKQRQSGQKRLHFAHDHFSRAKNHVAWVRGAPGLGQIGRGRWRAAVAARLGRMQQSECDAPSLNQSWETARREIETGDGTRFGGLICTAQISHFGICAAD